LPDGPRSSIRADGFCRWPGCGAGWIADRRRRSAAWIARRFATGFIVSTPPGPTGSWTSGPKVRNLGCRKSGWPHSRRSWKLAQRYDNAYLFGAICPARGVGAALALPHADTDMMQLHLDEIAHNVAEGAHAMLLLDRAGRHTTGRLNVPDNITPIFLPSRAPELNPVENVWQYLRQNWLSNTVFENYDAIVDAACDAWRKLTAEPTRITSIGMRDWAHIGQPV
jgi:hypothetical protein